VTFGIRRIEQIFVVVLPLVLAACALTDVSNSTPLPPITLAPPPSVVMSGSCDTTKNLESWLQITSQLVTNFQTQMNAAAAKSKNEMYTDVYELAALRDAAFAVETPDCAEQSQLILSDAMGQAVTMFQAYVNGDVSDLGTIVADTNIKLDTVIVQQTELLSRMDSQFQQSTGTSAP
jgi:hypothetical protein